MWRFLCSSVFCCSDKTSEEISLNEEIFIHAMVSEILVPSGLAPELWAWVEEGQHSGHRLVEQNCLLCGCWKTEFMPGALLFYFSSHQDPLILVGLPIGIKADAILEGRSSPVGRHWAQERLNQSALAWLEVRARSAGQQPAELRASYCQRCLRWPLCSLCPSKTAQIRWTCVTRHTVWPWPHSHSSYTICCKILFLWSLF